MVWFRYPAERARKALFVTIVDTPRGEAPEWVRQAWVGMRLPLAMPNAARFITSGVLTAPRNPLERFVALLLGQMKRTEAYAVNAKTAVDLLADHDPKAATWWREHVPHLLHGDRTFAFQADVCSTADHASTRH